MENSAFIALLNFHFIPRRVTYLVSENILLIIVWYHITVICKMHILKTLLKDNF